LFKECVVGGGIFDQPDLGLHGGCSFFETHTSKDGTICSHQIGCDYDHLGDDRYRYYRNKEDAAPIFRDAERLVDLLSKPAAIKKAEGAK